MIPCGVVLVTASSEAEAIKLANCLVDEALAACVAVFPVQSVYRWQGRTQQESEWQLTIKTNLDSVERLISRIQALHSYELPEIIALPVVAGAAAYLDWIATQTAQPID